MKASKLLLGIFVLSVCCFGQVASKRTGQPQCEQFIYERLRNYFEINEEKPSQIINNTESPPRAWKSQTQKITIGDHTVEWTDEVIKNDWRSTVKINGELIRLSDKVTTVGAPWGENHFTSDMGGQWEQIRLYDLYDQTIIAISMGPPTCTGLSCSAATQLWYDVKTKQKTFFGTFRTDPDARLFRFTNEEAFYVVGTNFDGDPHGVTSPSVLTYKLYKLQPNGQFQVQRNPAGAEYFVKHTSFPDMELQGDTVKKRKVVKCDKLEQNWIRKIE